MPPVVPEVFRKSGEQLVNYDFTDLLASVGYVTLYGIKDEADNYSLVRIQPQNADYRTKLNKTDAAGDLSSEVNFDFTFGMNQRVRGKLYVAETYEAEGNASDNCNALTKVRIYHVRGVTETEIGTQQTTTTIDDAASTGPDFYRAVLTFDVDKVFIPGDILRVNVEIHIPTNVGSVASFAALFHDGGNRNWGQTYEGVLIDSLFTVDVPFDLRGKL